MGKRAIITGAFSYTGAAVARELTHRGWSIHTLTNRSIPPGVDGITSSPLNFDPAYLKNTVKGADVFINTYWVRFPWKKVNFQTAIDNTRLLIKALKEAGVARLVHVSVSNADKGANLAYYRGKNELEKMVSACGISFAIVRPTLIVGPNDVLTNNIAWFLRRFPVFPVPQGGRYKLQPITLSDTARIIADTAESKEIIRVDAAGPDAMTFHEFVKCIAVACGLRRFLVASPDWFVLGALRLAGVFLRDVVLTHEELSGLQQELLCSSEPETGKESVIEWLINNAENLGRNYANDIKRHFGSEASKLITNPSAVISSPPPAP